MERKGRENHKTKYYIRGTQLLFSWYKTQLHVHDVAFNKPSSGCV